MVRIALAGNPNSGKSTLFNLLTGSNQYVGNWPGVTVEKKEGTYKKDKEVSFTDLPGIYSLSPYTLEEVVSRDYLLEEKPDVIIDVIDAANIERNLYLSTQLAELGIPLVLALNMMDVVKKNGDKIDTKALEEDLGCRVVEISALHKKGVDHLIEVAKEAAIEGKKAEKITYEGDIEACIEKIYDCLPKLKEEGASRFKAVKFLERDEKLWESYPMTPQEREDLDGLISQLEENLDDDGEGILTDARYNLVSEVTKDSVKKGRTGESTTDKIDRIVTNRFLALPIFAAIMFLVYYISISKVGQPITDYVNDNLVEGGIQAWAQGALEGMGTADWMVSLVVDGIIGGVGAVLGFLPVIACMFLLLAILEDVGYMSRIAFILDRIFRKFGLSGKSFIPILIGTGCAVPGIMATRTIESDQDRRMTVIVASFLPCGAKLAIISLFASAIFVGKWWFAPLTYFIGIAAVIISGIILKKTALFEGDPAPFVMELPEYHMPNPGNVLRSTYDRCKAFVIKAGTIILLATLAIWLLSNISVKGEFHTFDDDSTESILSAIGGFFAPIFAPLGFGDWKAVVAAFTGLVAKEAVVGTYGVVAGLGAGLGETDPSIIAYAAKTFTIVSALSFTVFNQLTVPCFAAVGAIRNEMNSAKWTWIAIGYQILFSYSASLMIYQFGRVLVLKEAVNAGTFVALGVLIVSLYLLFRPDPRKKAARQKVQAAHESH